jgi:ATP-grasp domain
VARGTVVTLVPGDDGRLPDLEPLQHAIRDAAAATGRAIVRGTLGAGGSSVFVTGPDGFVGPVGDAFTAQPAQAVYLVEEHLAVRASPNVQVFIHPATGRATCVSIADQLLTPALGYRGNVYPTTAASAPEMVEASLRMAGWLSRLGYRGVFGLDFIECDDPAGGTRWMLVEINPRFNGSTQAVAMLERLNRRRQSEGKPPIGGFAGGVLATSARTVPQLLSRLGARCYDPASACGVVPFHTAGLSDGMCGLVVFANSRADAVRVFDELEAEGKEGASAG